MVAQQGGGGIGNSHITERLSSWNRKPVYNYNYVVVIFCVGRSKGLLVLYESYSMGTKSSCVRVLELSYSMGGYAAYALRVWSRALAEAS